MASFVQAAIVVVLGTFSASGCSSRCSPDGIPFDYQDGLLDGYSALTCDLYDYDSSVISFSYELPKGVTPAAALDLLEARISRSAWRPGSHPPVTCFERRVRRDDYLLTVCESGSAWEFTVKGSRLRVTTGGARYVLQYFLALPVTEQ